MSGFGGGQSRGESRPRAPRPADGTIYNLPTASRGGRDAGDPIPAWRGLQAPQTVLG